jgi:hypothetical protein
LPLSPGAGCPQKRRDAIVSSGVKIYKIKDFIRKDESGELTRDRVKEIILEIGTAAAFHPDHNILIDFRETTISHDVNMTAIMKSAKDVFAFKDVLRNKIANIIPGDKDRISIAERAEAAIQLGGIHYKYFTDFEAAIEWLSDVKT